MPAACNVKNMTDVIEALESGEYPQGQFALRILDAVTDTVIGWCCAGVACDRAAKAGIGRWDGTAFTDATEDQPYEPTAGGAAQAVSAYAMTRGVLQWLGIDHADNAKRFGMGYSRSGVEMNDDGRPFGEIAAALREFYGIPKRDPES